MTDQRHAGDPMSEEGARGFMTDVPVETTDEEEQPALEQVLETDTPGATVVSDPLAVLDVRPSPAAPREYHFPRFERATQASGLSLVTCHVPGRPLLLAQLVIRGDAGGGATTEPDELAGVTVLTARALTEGTERRSAIDLIEAAERLGADLSADAGWDSFAVSVEVPRARLGPSLELLAEAALQPSFPADEVERLRDERINDLKQARADPRRRIERVFPETIYAPDAAYRRPLAGTEDTVSGIDRDAVVARHRAMMHASAATLVVCGDLDGVQVSALTDAAFGGWSSDGTPAASAGTDARAHPGGPRVVVVDRPGAAQTELRIGHIGLPRLIDDFHAVSVLNTILGGIFSSRLNQLLREDRGYTYGAHSAFDLRRGPGPFAVRTAVHSEVTVPAIQATIGELRRIREAPVTDDELTATRDYLVGVFPLRFETAGQVASALGGLIVFQLPDDELDMYRPAVAAVTADAVLTAARAHIRPDEASIVVIGDGSKFLDDLRGAGLGEVTVVREAQGGAERA